jgi:hypothetical protein
MAASKKLATLAVREESIASLIHFIRGERVMLDADLAVMYGVETRVLKQSVKRNAKRFPSDFMFVLSNREVDSLVSQSVIPSKSYAGGALPMAFTEQGVAMLSGILRSDRAIEVNITIMRTFVQMRTWMSAHRDLAAKLAELEKSNDENFQAVFDAIKLLTSEKSKPRRPIGFQTPGKK